MAQMAGPVKPVIWMGDSLDAVRAFPGPVQDEVGYAVYVAQIGGTHVAAKLLTALGSSVLEVVSDHRGDTFRAVYTVRLTGMAMCCTPSRRSRGRALPRQNVRWTW
jgi:phage-related protein